MTRTTHSPGTPDRRTPIGIEPAGAEDDARRRTAIAALLHRISGGLNNASMAFELALGGARADHRVLQAGFGGVSQAARGVALLSELLTPGSTNASHGASATLCDVVDILRASATLRGVALRIDGEPALEESATTPALAVASLLDGLAALDEASAGATASLAALHSRGDLRLRFVATAEGAES